MDYTPLISAYGSFFELSVAFNFAYAASKQFRELIKAGFLSDSEHLTVKIQSKIDDLNAQVTVIHSGGQLNPTYKENIEKKLSKSLESAREYQKDIKNSIDEAQPKVVDQLKSFYVIAALFGLFVLFLSGQESIHGMFPLNEVLLGTVGVSILFICLMVHSFFSDKTIPIIYMSFFSLVLFSISLFNLIPITSALELIDFSFPNKSLVNVSLAICIFPFIYAYTRLFVNAIKIYIMFRAKLGLIQLMLFHMKININNHKMSSKFFEDLDK